MAQPGGTQVEGDVRARLDALLPLVRSWQSWTDERRRPAEPVIRGFARAGLLRLLAPRAYGGEELDPASLLELVEAVAAVDGSAAWTIMTCNEEMGIASAYLPEGAVTELLRAAPDTVVAGSGLASGTSRPDAGGWRVDGRWRFVSGAPCADHLILGTVVEASRPRTLCFVLVPIEQVEVLDTWHVTGLRGTGSHDVVAQDVFVPSARAGEVTTTGATVPATTFYRLPYGLRFPFPKVGVACGVARAALDAFATLASEKTPVMARSSLRERAVAQAAMGEATAALSSGRAWVREVLAELWSTAGAGHPVSDELHARTRLACSTAVAGAVRAVDLVCSAAGSSVNFIGSPLDRCFRDVHAVPQHFMVAPYQAATAGRVLLGLDPDDPAF
ncbi:MAG: hypothetical protein GEV08_22650 [Acidimicrobiia bacterium]|nr:hypothetical protein [Acidimicrobiia bacterium]